MVSVTWNDLITQARRANGSLGDGITASAEEVQDDLLALNILLGEWSAVGFGVYADVQEVFSLTAGKSSYTWGTGAGATNFTTSRPTEVRDQSFLRIGDIDYPLSLIGQAQFAALSDKDITTSQPDQVYYDPTYPLGTFWAYPIPDETYPIYITSCKVLDSALNLTDTVVLPGEYASAIKWNLSVEVSPNYNVPVTPIMLKRAKESLNTVKSLNANNKLEPVRVTVADMRPSIYLRNINQGTW